MNQRPVPKPKTPQAEAMEWVLIGGVAAGALCYWGATNNAPVISQVAYGIARLAYWLSPGMYGLRMPHAPQLVASAAIGVLACFLIVAVIALVGIPDATERMANRLKRRGEKRRAKGNGRNDRWIVR
jgi:hypothetical protein